MAEKVTYDVIGVGVSTLDLLMLVEEFPSGEAVQRARASALQGGGPVATALVTLARLGARAAIIDRVGDDWRGRQIMEEFRREGISTDHLAVAPHRSSSIASILVRTQDGARSITYAPGDAGELSASDVTEEVLDSAGILHCNGRHLDACLFLAKRAKQHDVTVSFDGGAHRFRQELVPLIALTDVCIVAREFAFSYSGESRVEVAAAKLMDAGPEVVVITAGTDGSWLFSRKGESCHQPAFGVEGVVDTTGAGDAYHGAFLFGLLRGYRLRECGVLASAVAAMNTRKLGGRSALPSFDEAVAFLAERGIPLD